MTSLRSCPAARAGGIWPCRAAIRSQTWRRVLARALPIRASAAGPHPARARHAVESEATRPNSSSWWRRVPISLIVVAPSAIAAARSVTTRPRSCSGANPRRASAPDNPPVRPVRSASIRVAADPACDTTPCPPTSTTSPFGHDIESTC